MLTAGSAVSIVVMLTVNSYLSRGVIVLHFGHMLAGMAPDISYHECADET